MCIAALDSKFGNLVSLVMIDMRSFSISKIPSFMQYMVHYGLPETEESFEWLKDKIVDEFYGNFEAEWESEEHYNNYKEMTFDKYIRVVHREV